ncbi:uncharacterized protein LOC135291914 [Passer domesticus]|uniref:uncharacterized protein LOC135291914 n=1 Tax=Passer domesticus TaxID=48849 RepID=UPI0030FE8057
MCIQRTVPSRLKEVIPHLCSAEPAGEGGAASQATSRTEALGDAEGVSAGRTSPAPLLIPTQKPGNHGRGPPPEEIKDMADKKFQNPLEIMWQMLKEVLQRGQEMKGEPVQMEALPRGSSGSVPASAAGREVMPGTGTGAEPAGEGPTSRTEPLGDAEGVPTGRTSPAPGLDAWPQPSSHGRGPPKGKTQDTAAKKSHESDEFLTQTQKEAPRGQVMDQKAVQEEEHSERSSGSLAALAAGRKAMADTGTGTTDAAGTTRPVPNAQDGLGRGFCQGTGCWLGFLAGMLYLELVFMLCCIGIWYSWNRKQITSGQELEDGGCTSHRQREQLLQQQERPGQPSQVFCEEDPRTIVDKEASYCPATLKVTPHPHPPRPSNSCLHDDSRLPWCLFVF